jgi:hypothetical protein
MDKGRKIILQHRILSITKRGFIYAEQKLIGRPCLGVTHSDATRSHLSPLFTSLEKGYLCNMYIPVLGF